MTFFFDFAMALSCLHRSIEKNSPRRPSALPIGYGRFVRFVR